MKREVLEALRRGGEAGVDAGVLYAIDRKYATVVSNLRRDGHDISREKLGEGIVTYTLLRDACVCERKGCGEKMPKPSRTGYCGFCIEEKALGLRPHEKLREAVAA